jgi:hypothetical protein
MTCASHRFEIGTIERVAIIEYTGMTRLLHTTLRPTG